MKQTNKTRNIFLLKQTFFNCEKYLHANTLHTSSGTLPALIQARFRHARHSQKVLLLFLLSFQKIRGAGFDIFLKIKRGEVAPFPTLSFSLLSLLLQTETLLTYYILPIYISFICVSFVTLTNTGCFSFIHLSLLAYSFSCFVWLPIRFHGVYLSLSLSSSTDPPPLFHDTESVATPFLNFFIFQFSKIFLLKKCGMIYLHLECVYVGMRCLHIRCCLCVVG